MYRHVLVHCNITPRSLCHYQDETQPLRKQSKRLDPTGNWALISFATHVELVNRFLTVFNLKMLSSKSVFLRFAQLSSHSELIVHFDGYLLISPIFQKKIPSFCSHIILQRSNSLILSFYMLLKLNCLTEYDWYLQVTYVKTNQIVECVSF